jgi:hypothetical protein
MLEVWARGMLGKGQKNEKIAIIPVWSVEER